MTEAMTEDAVFELLSLECRVGTDGTVHYYNALGKLHRVHGPAVEYPDGSKFWYINGKALTKAEWQQVASMERV